MRHGAADLYLGRFDIPTDFAGKASSTSWTKISAKTGVGFSFGDYKGATHVRQCVTFTDSSGAGGGLKLRLRRTDHTKAKTVFFTDDVGHSWSGSGLIHHECGTWHSISGISCGYGWGATCQIDIQHAQGVARPVHPHHSRSSLPPATLTYPAPLCHNRTHPSRELCSQHIPA